MFLKFQIHSTVVVVAAKVNIVFIRFQVDFARVWIIKQKIWIKRTSSHLTNFSPSWSDLDTSIGPNDTYVPLGNALVAVLRGLCCIFVDVTAEDDGDTFVGVWCCGDCCSDLAANAEVAIFMLCPNKFTSIFSLIISRISDLLKFKLLFFRWSNTYLL